MAAEQIKKQPIESGELEQAVEALSARYRAPLVAFFRRRAPDRADAEDLAQEVFIRVLRRGGIGEVDNPEAFLFQTAANLVRDRQRRAIVRDQYAAEELALGERVEVLSPERVLQGREQLQTLLAALDELTEKSRDMFLLHRLERLKYHEIADLYGISVSAVEKHVMKALAHVAKRTGRP